MDWQNKQAFLEKMTKLKRVYVTYLSEWHSELEAYLRKMSDWDYHDTTSLQLLVHKLTGTGATYGYPAVTDLARSLEYKLAYANLEFRESEKNPNTNTMLVNDLNSLIALCATVSSAGEVGRMEMELEIAGEDVSTLANIPSEDLHNKTILIVDDHAIIRTTLSEALKSAGFNVIMANDGDDAFLIMQKRIPDLLVLDRVMPTMDGMTVLKTMRKVNSLKNVPVIFLTALYNSADIMAAEKLGVVDYVAKPFDVDEFVMRCLRVLHSAKSETTPD